jgi:hypothetical protein
VLNPLFLNGVSEVSQKRVFGTAQALMPRFGKLWIEDCVPWRTDARVVRIIGVIKRTPTFGEPLQLGLTRLHL